MNYKYKQIVTGNEELLVVCNSMNIQAEVPWLRRRLLLWKPQILHLYEHVSLQYSCLQVTCFNSFDNYGWIEYSLSSCFKCLYEDSM